MPPAFTVKITGPPAGELQVNSLALLRLKSVAVLYTQSISCRILLALDLCLLVTCKPPVLSACACCGPFFATLDRLDTLCAIRIAG